MQKKPRTSKSNSMSNKSKDPHFERESSRYENPIPSREYILEFLEKAGGKLKFKAIQNGLGLFEPEQEIALSRRLKAMQRDGQIHCDRRGAYGIVNKLDLVPGTVIGHRDGFGFFKPDSGGEDWLISARQMRKVFHGERALAYVSGANREGRKEAVIVEILEREQPLRIVGRYYEESGIRFVTPEDRRITQDILIPPDDPLRAKPGQVVVAEVRIRPTERSQAVGSVVDILGDYLAPGMEIKIAIAQYGIRDEWNDEIYNELERLPVSVSEQDCQGRVDLRHLPLITIDGDDAKDFDDAVYCQPRKNGGWKLYVAIADVSHYVTPGSALDKEAALRGNSVYFPDSVIPMLPEQVSNGLCSLRPHEDRLCMVCEINLDEQGKVTRSKFYPAVMHSKARMTYDKVWAILQGDEQLREHYAELVQPIENLHKLYQLRLLQKKRRGAIDFETTETRIIFNDNKKIENIIPVIRNDAHKIIEECMICANICAAQFFIKHKSPGLYRVHKGPKAEKLERLRQYLAQLGLFIVGGDEPEPKVFARLMEEVKHRPDVENIQLMILRSMSQAEYSPFNEGHFGLAFEAYTHFTSPIRRYPDLIVHRIIKAIVALKQEGQLSAKKLQEAIPYNLEQLNKIAVSCSQTERNADLATRDVIDWLKCEYMLDKIGNVYAGEISAVTHFGAFVRLKDVYVEGLVHITEFGNDYFHYDERGQALVGERSRQKFSIGDELMVKVSAVDIEARKIDFTLSKESKVRHKLSEREKLYAKARAKAGKKSSANKAKVADKEKKRGRKNKRR